jgi:hypothetical protein
VKIDVLVQNENFWLSQSRISELFGVDRTVITKHLKNIFNTNELDKNAVCAKFAHTADDGKKYQTQFYNIDAVISVGYRVNSHQATQFRIWATERLKEYIIKGFTMDDERLKNPQNIFGKDYFEEQLERIRDIRSSERRFYLKITDIYAQCSADYSVNSNITKDFFSIVQNKLHWAITGLTASEIINTRANSDKENMGLTTWKNAPKGSIRKADVGVAKNYLNKDELNELNRIVTMYLDYAEMQARNGKVMYMKDWVKKLDGFLQFNEQAILQNAGKISHELAIAKAENEYEKYHQKQLINFESDFEKAVAKSIKSNTQVRKDSKK